MSDMSHEQMLLDKYHKMVDNANNEAWKVEELEKKNKELKEEIEDLEEELNDKKLLMVSDGVGGVVNVREIMKQMDICRFVKEKNDKLEEENKELKELTDGIMNEPGTGHILGCNAYEKFCQAMSELNYDEKWIGELMLEVAENDTEEDILVSIKEEIKKLKEENKQLKDYSKDCLGLLDKQLNGDQSTSSTISPKLCKSVYGYNGRIMKTRQSSEFRIRINDNKILYYKSPTNKKRPQPAVVTKLYEKDGNWFYAQSSGRDRKFYDAVSDKIVNNHSLIDAAN
jgi:uncharacterized protein YhaN